jgi:hypothetical protein
MIASLQAAGVVAAGVAGAGVALAATSTTPIQVAQFVRGTSTFTDTFTSCTGLRSTSDVASSTTTSGAVVYGRWRESLRQDRVTRRVSTDFSLEKWRASVINIQPPQADATLVTLGQNGARRGRWSLTGVWPSDLHDTPVAATSVMNEAVTPGSR